MAAALADGGVERIALRVWATEGRDIGLAEAADRVGGELHLAHRHEVERAHLADRALRLGIEGADRFQRRAEEVESHRVWHAGREEVDDAAPHRIFAGVAHDVGAQEAVDLEPFGELVGRDRIARRPPKSSQPRPCRAAARAAAARSKSWSTGSAAASGVERERARRDSTVIRRAAIEAFGETRS